MKRGTSTTRTVIALGLLAGFYVYALAWAAGVLVLALWAARTLWPGLDLAVAIGCGTVAAGVLSGLLASLRRVPYEFDGREVPREEAPKLWAFVDETAERVGTASPDTLLLIPEVNAFVAEEHRLIGLVPGHRTLAIGVPLLASLALAELRAVLAHECGHYAHLHTRGAAITYRAQIAIHRIRERLRRQWWNPLTWPVHVYAAVFLLVAAAVSRDQEREADRCAARLAGRTAMQRALRALPVVERAWRFYDDVYLSHGRPHGLVPAGVVAGYRTLWDVRRTYFTMRERKRATPAEPHPFATHPPAEPHPFATHPPVAERVEALAELPARGELRDSGPADALLPDALWNDLDALVTEVEGCEALDWAVYTARSYSWAQRLIAAAAYRFLAHETGVNPPTLASVLDAYDLGHGEALLAKIAGPLFPAHGLAAMVMTAAYDSDALFYRHRWTGDLLVFGADRREFDPGPILDALTTPTPEGAARTRELLAEAGIDLAVARGERVAHPVPAGPFLGISAGVRFDGEWCDMAVTARGLLLVPAHPSSDDLKRVLVLHYQVDPVTGPLPDGTVWLPADEWAHAELADSRRIRLTVETLDGTRHTIAEPYAPLRRGDPRADLAPLLAYAANRPSVPSRA